jgi:hypothetical protein
VEDGYDTTIGAQQYTRGQLGWHSEVRVRLRWCGVVVCVTDCVLLMCDVIEWEATSTHRFRSPSDMQYSFAFFYYLMNRHKARHITVT